PSGLYAREALAASNVLEGVQKGFVYGENSRQVVDSVAGGDADAGFVYATDIPLGGDRIDLAFQVPDRLHAPIVYEAAVIRAAKSAVRARAFLAFLGSAARRALFLARC